MNEKQDTSKEHAQNCCLQYSVSCLGCRSNLDSAFLFAFLNTTCWGNRLAFVLNYVHILKKQVDDINIAYSTALQAAPFCLKRHWASSSCLLALPLPHPPRAPLFALLLP